MSATFSDRSAVEVRVVLLSVVQQRLATEKERQMSGEILCSRPALSSLSLSLSQAFLCRATDED